ncbi:J domain-containing protein [Lysobacter korlensis]|uniref:J domain-containing protein n=1 Tax=Lysobacter korlensis TaxID=553636 RepID=A0ABV6RRN5_9GAMM
MVTHYTILKVASDAPIEVIRAAYRVLAARHHPDRCAGEPAALQRMQRINEAYRVLSDPSLRAEHDATLQHKRRRRASDGGPRAAALTTQTAADSVAPAVIALRRRAAEMYTAHAGLGVRSRH